MTLLLVGCGKMGAALLHGWLAQGTPAASITVVEPDGVAAQNITLKHGVRTINQADELAPDYAPDVVIFAVKPQIMDKVLPPYSRLVSATTVFLSIAAGRTLDSFASVLGDQARVVRAMPNTPASIGRGITVCCPNTPVVKTQIEQCTRLMAAVGDVEWVKDETLMDAVTAVSGSGPAYIFLLAEAMGQAGHKAGLDLDLANRLARATVAGAGELLHQSALPAVTLRENVTSPGGTTAAALDVLMGANGLERLMTDAIAAATKRSLELAKS